ncbi:MAG: hypothetical protein V4627_00635 [Pseudomonadota bacterium]
MKRFKSSCTTVVVTAALLLAGCGGGGAGNTATTPSPAPIPMPTPHYSVGGGVVGLLGASGLTLVNGSETLPVAPHATAFTFANTVAHGSPYSVSVGSQPSGLVCNTSNASGTMAQAAVVTVVVNCTPVQGKSPFTVSTFAGSDGQTLVDGVGSSARFGRASAIAMDGAGNKYVADSVTHSIRKISPAGVVTTLAGNGTAGFIDGTGANARFNTPMGVAVDGAGNVYVSDTSNNAIRKIAPSGAVTTLAGMGPPGMVDAVGSAAQFNQPYGIAVDAAGTVYVGDTYNRVIRKITPSGAVSTLAGSGQSGFADGVGANAVFNEPKGVVVDSAGTLYVTDFYTVRKISASGVVTTLTGAWLSGGEVDGALGVARFGGLAGIAMDGTGNLYVTDDHTPGSIRKISNAGVVTTLARGNQGLVDGSGLPSMLQTPAGLVADNTGNLFVVNKSATISMLSPTGVVTNLAGPPLGFWAADGMGTTTRFSTPNDVATDAAGNVYVADLGSLSIRKITPSGAVTTLAGGFGRDLIDGIGTAARFKSPSNLAVDSAGNVYVIDFEDQTLTIILRKITPTGVVTTLFGNGTAGLVDATGATVRLPYATKGIAVDGAGVLYLSAQHAILKITPNGLVTTLAGNVNSAGFVDGTASAARFNYLRGIAVDAAGNVYVADHDNNAIRKISPQGQVTTLVTGSPMGPVGVAVDPAGNIYATGDVLALPYFGSYRYHGGNAYKISSTGVVTAVAGGGSASGQVDGPAASARFNYVAGIAVDGAGNVFVADYNNNAIRKIVP